MAYELQSNPINQGALAGRYALKDLSNTGKFSNIINAIPIRYRLVLGNDIEGNKVLTLVEGSTVTIPDGHSDTNSDTTLYEYATVDKYIFETTDLDTTMTIVGSPNDATADKDPEKYVYIVYNKVEKRLELGTGNEYTGFKFTVSYTEDGATTTVDQAHAGTRNAMEWKEVENYWYGPMGGRTSIPLGYFDGNWNLHQFHALGFYDNLFWVDRDVEILVPDGRTDIFGLSVNNVTISKLSFTKFDGGPGHQPPIAFESFVLLLRKDGVCIATEEFRSYTSVPQVEEPCYIYLSSDNFVYSAVPSGEGVELTKQEMIKLCDMKARNGKFMEITGENVYQAANLKDLKDDITELQETTVHLTGDEDITGTKHFVDPTGDKPVIFDNSIHNHITIHSGEVPDGDTFIVNGTVKIEHTAEDFTKINELCENNAAYDSDLCGGLGIITDAYLVGIEYDRNHKCKYANARNCLNIVGASKVSEGGVILGRYRTDGTNITRMVKLYGDSSGNLSVHAESILPSKTGMNIGAASDSQKFNVVYANTFNGTATRALWADLAEVYETDFNYPVGTLLAWGGYKEMTLATEEVNAVVSENPAYLMNAEGKGQPVALAGRVRVRVVDKVSKFDKIYLSSNPGIGQATPRYPGDTPIARALESNENIGEKLVLCAVHFSI